MQLSFLFLSLPLFLNFSLYVFVWWGGWGGGSNLVSELAHGVYGSVYAQDHCLEAHSTTIVLGNHAPMKARGQGLLRTLLAVCNTKAYAAPKQSKETKAGAED